MIGTRGASIKREYRGRSRLAVLLALTCGVIASGCAPKSLYGWGRYEESLYASYVTHDDTKAATALEATVTTDQNTGQRVPPGVCAEYGFTLYKRGQDDGAIKYFEEEARLFPESKPLMDRLVTKVREHSGRDAHGSATGDPTR